MRYENPNEIGALIFIIFVSFFLISHIVISISFRQKTYNYIDPIKSIADRTRDLIDEYKQLNERATRKAK